MARPKLRVLRHLARTGGTLISRCLGCMEGVVLLSEAHPLAIDRWSNVLGQAHKWHGLVTDQDLKAWKKRGGIGYPEILTILTARAEAAGKILLVREWSHLDYLGLPFVKDPPMRPAALDGLAERFGLVVANTVRHPLDHWLSLSSLEMLPGLALPGHLASCRAFAESAAEGAEPGGGIVRYEDFCSEPERWVAELCARLKIPFDESWRSKWAAFEHITGDAPGAGRSSGSVEIAIPTRRQIPPAMVGEFRAQKDYIAACEAWGYPP